MNGVEGRAMHPLVESRPTPTFCDVCNKIAFGILLQCKKCGLICHRQCQVKIQFHCESDTERTLNAGKNKVCICTYWLPHGSAKLIRKSGFRNDFIFA